MGKRQASRTPSPQRPFYEETLLKSASTSTGGDETPLQRSISPAMRFACLQEEQSLACLRRGLHVRDLTSTNSDPPGRKTYEEQITFGSHLQEERRKVCSSSGFGMPSSQAHGVEDSSSMQESPERNLALMAAPSCASPTPEMSAAQMPVLHILQPAALRVQVMCLQSPVDKGKRWADMEDELLAADSEDVLPGARIEDVQCFSLGSTGHPLQCNAPCKYSFKPKGCKDGVDCDRCHLCKWTKPKTPIQVVHPRARRGKKKTNRSWRTDATSIDASLSLQTMSEA